jgi:hypothetical protein
LGIRALVYLPTGGAVDVAVQGGPYRATWIDAQDPAERRAAEARGDGRRWVAPADGDDWLLYLELI